MVSALATLLVALVFAPAAHAAGEAGTSGLNFLKIAAGPRAEAMGGAHVSVADDAYAAYWNPGGLVQLRHPELAAAHSQQMDGVSEQFVSYVYPFAGGRTVSASFTRLAVSPFDAYDNNGARTGSVSSDDTAAGMAAAQAFSLPGEAAPVIGLGAGAQFVRERLGSDSASTVVGDVGLWSGGWESWVGSWAKGARLGFAVRHLGPRVRFVSEQTRLPTTIAAGASVDKRVWGDPMTFAVEAARTNNESAVVSLGGEYWVHRLIGLRLGLHRGSQEGVGFRFGLGMRIRVVQVDYAFSNVGALGNSHQVGMTFKFGVAPSAAGRSVAEHIQSARDLLGQDRHYDAIQEAAEALSEDPGNQEAISLLREIKVDLQRSQDKGDQDLIKRTEKKLDAEERKSRQKEEPNEPR